MNEIIEKTRELGELIQNSEEMKNAKNAEILQENDDEAQAQDKIQTVRMIAALAAAVTNLYTNLKTRR